MIYSEVLEIINLIKCDKYIRTSSIIVVVFIFLLGLTYSILAAFLIYISFFFSYLVCWILLKYQHCISKCLQTIISFCNSGTINSKNIKSSCSICDDLSCIRHIQNRNTIPWKNLYIQKDLNDAIEHFCDRILNEFITFWYKYLTDDVDFVNELRYCLRYALANAINKIIQINHSKIIAQKLLPAFIKHIDDYLYMQQIVKLKNVRLNDVIIEYLGKRLHIATTNRKNELNYLQNLSTLLLKQIFPKKYQKCKNFNVLLREIIAGWVLLPLMDVLSDPNSINLLILFGINNKSKRIKKSIDQIEKIEFLKNFIKINDKISSFSTNLNTIKINTDLLYAFMQFLKNENQVHLLQFCLDVDEFNNKLLTPDLSKKQLEKLHSEALILYKEYLNENSINFVGCPKDIIDDFYKLIDEGVYSVAKLRTSKPLYQAYEFTFNLLENSWLPLFFHSNEFYKYICGSKVTANYNKSNLNRVVFNFGSPIKGRNRKYCENTNQSTVSKISSGLGKIKGALKTSQPIEGAVYPTDFQAIENGNVEDIIITDCGNIFRDMSEWKISILSYQITNKIVNFCINIQRLDVINDDNKKRYWVILRRDQDFYTLKGKLIEFHGENEICDSPLPSRKAGSPIETRMAKYEHFLKNLLQKPFLRGSDLLYTFLTTEEDFSLLMSNVSNNQDIGNIYQSVAHKLRKEKGQNLDAFMQTFLSSIGKTKLSKLEWAEIGDEYHESIKYQQKNPSIPRTYRNHIFNDNFGIIYNDLKEASSGSLNPNGVTECIFYLMKHVYKMPHYLLRMYAAICSIAKNSLESFIILFIEKKFKSNLSQSNLAYLITLLEGIVFTPYRSPTKQDLEDRKLKVFQELDECFSPLIRKITNDTLPNGTKTLLQFLQHPHYNKQLAYTFFDIILMEMYPNLNEIK